MRSRLSLWVTLAVLAVSASARADLAPGLHTGLTLSFGGFTRSYDVLVPASYTGASVPLVVDLHGFTRTPAFQRAQSGFAGLAQTYGFIVAWPAGLGLVNETGWS